MATRLIIKAPLTVQKPSTFIHSDGKETKIDPDGKAVIDSSYLGEVLAQGFVVIGEE